MSLRPTTPLMAIVLVVVAFGAFGPSLRNGFILDDEYMVVGNAAIRDLRNVPGFFVSTPPGVINRGYYRPMMLAAFAIDYALFGNTPTGFHALNILVHAAVALLVFLLLAHFVGRSWQSAAGALLFAIHPVQGEVVYLVTYRATALAAFFYFAALLLYLRQRAWPRSVVRDALLGLLYFCSVASKEIGITLPLAMLLCDVLQPVGPRRLGPYVACALVAVLYFVLRALLCQPSGVSYFGQAPALSVFLAMVVAEAYAVLLLLLPVNLAGTYDASYLPLPSSLGDPIFALALGVLLGTLLLAFRLRRSAPLISLAIAFHFIALLPTYNLVPIPNLFGERFLYVASLGFCLLVATLLSRIEAKVPRRIAWAVCSAIGMLFATQTHVRARDWHDAESFWRATVAARPGSVQAHLGLATTLRSKKCCAQALPHYEFAIDRVGAAAPTARPIYGEAASCYSLVGRSDRSRVIVEGWLALHPNDAGFRSMRDQLVASAPATAP